MANSADSDQFASSEYLMANRADSDQLASSEANWSGSTLFAKAGYIQVQQDKVNASRNPNPSESKYWVSVDFSLFRVSVKFKPQTLNSLWPITQPCLTPLSVCNKGGSFNSNL